MKGYPIITKEFFYYNYSKDLYKYHNQSYKESDDSVLLFRDDIISNKTLIFQLVAHLQNELPEHRKNLYVLLKEDHDRLRKEILQTENKNKKISAQILSKFVDPYDKEFINITKQILNKDIVNSICLQLNCPLVSKSFEYLVESKNNPEREIMNLTLSKELIEKKIYYLKNKKKV